MGAEAAQCLVAETVDCGDRGAIEIGHRIFGAGEPLSASGGFIYIYRSEPSVGWRGAPLQCADRITQAGPQALAHLGSRTLGEGDHQHLVCSVTRFDDVASYKCGDSKGFARAGTRL